MADCEGVGGGHGAGSEGDEGMEGTGNMQGAVFDADLPTLDDVPVAAGVGGDGESTILTRFMVVNATVLFEATGYKVREFRELVKATEPKPHVIIVHEVNGCERF